MNETQGETLSQHGSLVRRLTLTALLWGLTLLLVGALALTLLFRQTILSDLDDRLADVVDFLIVSAEVDDAGEFSISRQPTDTRYKQVFSGRYWQISAVDGEGASTARLRSRSLWDEALLLPAGLVEDALATPGRPVSGDAKGPDGEPLRLYLRSVLLPGLESPVLIAAAEDRRPADARVTQFGLTSLFLFALFAAALVIGIMVQVRVGLDPVFRMGRDVAAVRDGVSDQLSGRYPSELMPLAGELNSLMDHSREVVERARTHVGNLAHALKTPISVLSNEARSGEGPLAELVERQTSAMSAQVEHHLRRARAAANARAIGARTPVDDVLNDLGRTLSKIYARKGVSVEWTAAEGLLFRGERQDLEDLVGNLLDNACKWSGGSVTARAGVVDDTSFELVVEDDGPGLTAEARARVLGRGVRLDEQTPGTGLGLAIVTDLARAYDGRLELGESPLGGLLARLVLPRARTTGETRR